MLEAKDFTNNFNDLTTEKGFQFEFCCDRCGNCERSQFKGSALAAGSSLLDHAANFFGGLFATAREVAVNARNESWKGDREKAFLDAIEEMRPKFKRCAQCERYVCLDCWDATTDMCLDCAAKARRGGNRF